MGGGGGGGGDGGGGVHVYEERCSMFEEDVCLDPTMSAKVCM